MDAGPIGSRVIERRALADLIVMDGDPVGDLTVACARPGRGAQGGHPNGASPSTDSPRASGTTMDDPAGPKVAFVTGAASGIGRAAAEAFVQRGYAAVLADVNAEAGKEVEAELEARSASAGSCPATSPTMTRVREAVATRSPPTGGSTRRSTPPASTASTASGSRDATMENWNRVIAVDLTGTFSCMRDELPAIVEAGGGAIVNCASVAGLRAAPSVGLHRRQARRRRTDEGRRPSSTPPPGCGSTPSARARSTRRCSVPVHADEFVDQLVATNPSRRLADASEIAVARGVALRGRTGFLTGQAITVDGGASA